jgi:hypothetical protein
MFMFYNLFALLLYTIILVGYGSFNWTFGKFSFLEVSVGYIVIYLSFILMTIELKK